MPPTSPRKSPVMVINCKSHPFPSALSECGVLLTDMIEIQAQNLAHSKMLLDIYSGSQMPHTLAKLLSGYKASPWGQCTYGCLQGCHGLVYLDVMTIPNTRLFLP